MAVVDRQPHGLGRRDESGRADVDRPPPIDGDAETGGPIGEPTPLLREGPARGPARRTRTRSKRSTPVGALRCRSRWRNPFPGSWRSVSYSSNRGRLAVSTRAFATVSSYSPSALEPHVMPPPTPYSALRLSVSRSTVRIGTLNRAAGASGPGRGEEADGAAVHAARSILELGDDLHRADLGRARDGTAGEEGTEDVDRAASPARARPRPWTSAATRSRSARGRTRRSRSTEPVRAILPMSLRSRSTIIAFSARSLTDPRRPAATASSSADHRPLGAVPFIGLVVMRPSSIRKNSSGEAESTR